MEMFRRMAFGCAWALVFLVALAATAAGGPDAVGSLVGSRNATLDGQAPLPHTVLLNGDKLAVNDGLAMVALARGNRMVLGQDSEASFLRDAQTLTVLMARGTLSLFHPRDGTGLRVKAGSVIVTPVEGAKTLGEIAVADGLLLVTSKDGSLKIEKDGTTSEVTKGHTMTIATAAAGTAASTLPGNSHLKHVLNHGAPFGFESSAGGASAATVAIALHHHHRHVSPIRPRH
jgi:hypothetical protein